MCWFPGSPHGTEHLQVGSNAKLNSTLIKAQTLQSDKAVFPWAPFTFSWTDAVSNRRKASFISSSNPNSRMFIRNFSTKSDKLWSSTYHKIATNGVLQPFPQFILRCSIHCLLLFFINRETAVCCHFVGPLWWCFAGAWCRADVSSFPGKNTE